MWPRSKLQNSRYKDKCTLSYICRERDPWYISLSFRRWTSIPMITQNLSYCVLSTDHALLLSCKVQQRRFDRALSKQSKSMALWGGGGSAVVAWRRARFATPVKQIRCMIANRLVNLRHDMPSISQCVTCKCDALGSSQLVLHHIGQLQMNCLVGSDYWPVKDAVGKLSHNKGFMSNNYRLDNAPTPLFFPFVCRSVSNILCLAGAFLAVPI